MRHRFGLFALFSANFAFTMEEKGKELKQGGQASEGLGSAFDQVQGRVSKQPPATEKPNALKKTATDPQYANTSDQTWTSDKNATTGLPIEYPNVADANARMEQLRKLGEWEEFQVVPGATKGSHVVQMKGKRTINNFIKLIKKVEAAYPTKSTDEIIDLLRSLAPGYNTDRFRILLGKKQRAPQLKPVKDILTDADIAALKAMIEHGGEYPSLEKGVLKDNGGDYLAMGHVLTGITAGINRDKNKDMTSGFWESAAGTVGVGENIDNLHAATISGDLGQSAAVKNKAGLNQDTQFVGNGTEATHAEMIGDLDGFNIGSEQSDKKKSPVALSALLSGYYQKVAQDEKKHRYEKFEQVGGKDLQNQIKRFAVNYNYSLHSGLGKLGAATDDIGLTVSTTMAYAQFQQWLEKEKKSPNQAPSTPGKEATIAGASNEVMLVGEPSRYKSTKIAFLSKGESLVILDRGDNMLFNKEVQNRAVNGWTKVMVKGGRFEGKIGWVSNAFLLEKK
jgi:hypothetical protein